MKHLKLYGFFISENSHWTTGTLTADNQVWLINLFVQHYLEQYDPAGQHFYVHLQRSQNEHFADLQLGTFGFEILKPIVEKMLVYMKTTDQIEEWKYFMKKPGFRWHVKIDTDVADPYQMQKWLMQHHPLVLKENKIPLLPAIQTEFGNIIEGDEMGFYVKENAYTYTGPKDEAWAKNQRAICRDYIRDHVDWHSWEINGWTMEIEPNTDSWCWYHPDHEFYVYASLFWVDDPDVTIQLTQQNGEDIDLEPFGTIFYPQVPEVPENREEYQALAQKYVTEIMPPIFEYLASDDFQAYLEGGEMGFYTKETWNIYNYTNLIFLL